MSCFPLLHIFPSNNPMIEQILIVWAARDIQAWEYVPLGPFLGKSFGEKHMQVYGF